MPVYKSAQGKAKTITTVETNINLEQDGDDDHVKIRVPPSQDDACFVGTNKVGRPEDTHQGDGGNHEGLE